MLPAVSLTPLDLVTRVGFHPVPLVVLAALAGSYWYGVRRLASRGRRWPEGRSLAWGLGILLLAAATLSGLTAYSRHSFEVVAVQQLFLFLLAPVALCLGAPLTLAVEAAGGPEGRRLEARLVGRTARVLRDPILAWALFAGGLFGLYLSRQFAWSLAHPAGTGLVDLELLVIGCAWVWPVMGADPRPVRLGIGWRVLYVLLAVVYFSVLGLAMESQRHPIAPGISVASLHAGADVIWSTGALLSIGATIAMVFQWLEVDLGHARTADRSNAAEDARQLALWRASRRQAGLADRRAAEAVIARSRPAGTERSDASALATVRSAPARRPPDPEDAGRRDDAGTPSAPVAPGTRGKGGPSGPGTR